MLIGEFFVAIEKLAGFEKFLEQFASEVCDLSQCPLND